MCNLDHITNCRSSTERQGCFKSMIIWGRLKQLNLDGLKRERHMEGHVL